MATGCCMRGRMWARRSCYCVVAVCTSHVSFHIHTLTCTHTHTHCCFYCFRIFALCVFIGHDSLPLSFTLQTGQSLHVTAVLLCAASLARRRSLVHVGAAFVSVTATQCTTTATGTTSVRAFVSRRDDLIQQRLTDFLTSFYEASQLLSRLARVRRSLRLGHAHVHVRSSTKNVCVCVSACLSVLLHARTHTKHSCVLLFVCSLFMSVCMSVLLTYTHTYTHSHWSCPQSV